MQTTETTFPTPRWPLSLPVVAPFLCVLLATGIPAPASPQTAQETDHFAAPSGPIVPQQVPFAGKLPDQSGRTAQAVFRIYAAAQGGDPLWTEEQSVTVDSAGNFEVLLGSSSPDGLPQTLFARGQARWVGVSINGADEADRTSLPSTAYAMKAADAETLGGFPATAFATRAQLEMVAKQLTAQAVNQILPSPETTPSGTGAAGYLPIWSTASTLGNSAVFQGGTASAPLLGVNTANPSATLDVGGAANIQGLLNLPPLATATSSTGQRSQLVQLSASTWSSATNAAIEPTFKILTNFVDNDTASAAGRLEIHYQPNALAASLNVLSINGNGTINFAPGQTFPGAGTITGVTTGPGLTGGGTSGAVTVGIPNAGITDAMLSASYAGTGTCSPGTAVTALGRSQAPTCSTVGAITGVTAGTGLTGGGTSGAPTLSVNAAVVPLLGQMNAFTEPNEFESSLIAYPNSTSSVYQSFLITAGIQADSGKGCSVCGFPVGVMGTTDFGFGLWGAASNGTGVRGTALTGTGGSFATTNYLGNATSETYQAALVSYNAGSGGALQASNSGYGTAAYITGDGASGLMTDQLSGFASGLWSDSYGESAIIGSSAEYYGGAFFNNSSSNPTLEAINYSGGASGLVVAKDPKELDGVFRAQGNHGVCAVSTAGDVSCTGQIKAINAVSGGARKVETYAVQSPENWVEDFGSGTLQRGVALIGIDPAFAETISADSSYHVFLTPNGDSKGLYVINKSAGGFEVRESGGGTSSLEFDYRIVAKRRGYESQRLTDVTERFNAEADRAAHSPQPQSDPNNALPHRPVQETGPKPRAEANLPQPKNPPPVSAD